MMLPHLPSARKMPKTDEVKKMAESFKFDTKRAREGCAPAERLALM
jgi:hypothetical protein